MEDFVLAVTAAAVICLPIALLLRHRRGKKGGCGRGCSSCSSRALCQWDQETGKQQEKQEKSDD